MKCVRGRLPFQNSHWHVRLPHVKIILKITTIENWKVLVVICQSCPSIFVGKFCNVAIKLEKDVPISQIPDPSSHSILKYLSRSIKSKVISKFKIHVRLTFTEKIQKNSTFLQLIVNFPFFDS